MTVLLEMSWDNGSGTTQARLLARKWKPKLLARCQLTQTLPCVSSRSPSFHVPTITAIRPFPHWAASPYSQCSSTVCSQQADCLPVEQSSSVILWRWLTLSMPTPFKIKRILISPNLGGFVLAFLLWKYLPWYLLPWKSSKVNVGAQNMIPQCF